MESPVDVAIILDPMLATGGSVMAALMTLREWGVKQVKVVVADRLRKRIEPVTAQFPETHIYVCVVDPILNDHKYIVPGLGDAETASSTLSTITECCIATPVPRDNYAESDQRVRHRGDDRPGLGDEFAQGQVSLADGGQRSAYCNWPSLLSS